MEHLTLHAHYIEQYRDTKNPVYIQLPSLIERAINTDFWGKEHLSNWLDEEIEDWFHANTIKSIGQQAFDDEICKIAGVIAAELGLQ